MATQTKTDDVYKVYYWEPSVLWGGSGRSEYIKLVLEEAGVPYVMDHDQIYEKFKGQKTWAGYPAFAVPLIEKGGFNLSQTGVVCRYLGKKHGLYPDNEQDEWHADQLNTTVHDYVAEAQNAFHGSDPSLPYFSQKEETKPYLDFFVKERVPKFLQHFEKALAANKGGHGFMVGNNLTYVDLAVFHVVRATESQFPEVWASLKASLPLLVAFKDRLYERPRLKAYLQSDRHLPFCGVSMM